jgi:hypothetical protein
MKPTTMLRAFVLGLALTSSMGAVAHADRCVPDPNAICPLIYAPVICNDGVTYSNQCFADANCAKGCRPAGLEA